MISHLLREAAAGEADQLTGLERAASLEALAHVFPPAEFPYPTEEVRDRWHELLGDPAVHVGVAEDESGLAALVVFDDEVLRHLAVRPDLWGSGLAASAVGWALAFYRRLGWTPSGRRGRAEFPPYPTEIELRTESP